MRRHQKILLLLACLFSDYANSSPVTLDATFGTGGIVSSNIAMVLSDISFELPSKILGTGGQNFFAARFNMSDGSLDTTFNTIGYEDFFPGTSTLGVKVFLQTDSKIVWFGNNGATNSGFVVRTDNDGALDTATFNTPNGYYSTAGSGRINSGTLQTDQKIVAVGTTGAPTNTWLGIRLNTDGTLDGTFVLPAAPLTGAVITDIVNTIPDKFYIIANGSSPVGTMVAKLNNDGSFDTSFGAPNGYVVFPNNQFYKIIDTGSNIFIAGSISSSTAVLYKLNTDGTLDTTFGTGGQANFIAPNFTTASSFVIQPDNKILVAGQNNTASLVLTRLNADGSTDTTFNDTGYYINTSIKLASDVLLQPLDRKILVAASNNTISQFVLARFNAPNTPTPTANAVTTSTNENTTVTVNLSGTDPVGGGLTFTIVTNPSNGILSGITETSGTTATVDYTPINGFTGTDTFTYRVTDSNNTQSSPATVTITVNISTNPTADNVDVTTTEATGSCITLTGTDPLGQGLTFAIITEPSHGQLTTITPVTATTANVFYSPSIDFTGTDTFTYHATDANDNVSNAATVTITVNTLTAVLSPLMQKIRIKYGSASC